VVSAFERYMPVLKWRQGEYQALLKLHDSVKERVLPLIEITPPDFDFELWQPKKTVDGHLERVPERLWKKWGPRPALIDTSLIEPAERMIGGIHPLTFVLDGARSHGSRTMLRRRRLGTRDTNSTYNADRGRRNNFGATPRVVSISTTSARHSNLATEVSCSERLAFSGRRRSNRMAPVLVRPTLIKPHQSGRIAEADGT
jgi:hypothetical protein